MAYNITKFNEEPFALVADGTINKTLDITLIGKNYAGYGEAQNNNFLWLLEHFANVNSPPKPIIGQAWFNSTVDKLKLNVYDGTGWKTLAVNQVGPTSAGEQATAGTPNLGDMWYDTTNNQLRVYNGTEYTLVGPQSVTGFGITQMRSVKIQDSQNNYHAIQQAWANDQLIFIVNAGGEFTPSTSIIGYPTVFEGITLNSSYKLHGTATNSEKLGNQLPSFYAPVTNPTFLTSINVHNDGVNIGTALTIKNIDGTPTIKNNSGTTIRFQTTSGSTENTPLQLVGAHVLPGTNAATNLGSDLAKFDNVYATYYYGVAQQADSLSLAGNPTNASTAAGPLSIAARNASGNLVANRFIGKADDSLEADHALLADNATLATTANVANYIRWDQVDQKPSNFVYNNAETYNISIQGNVQGNVTGNVTGNTTGFHTGNVSGAVTGNVTGNTTGLHTGNVVGNVTGNLTGNTAGIHTGDVTGNTTGFHTGNVTGNVTGDVTGNTTGLHTGNVTGNVTGNTTGLHNGNVIGNVTGNLTGDSQGTHSGNVVGNLFGNVTGNVIGNVTGDLTGNADTTTKWANSRTITLAGDLSGSVSIDGSSNVTLTATVASNTVALGTDTTGNYIATAGVTGNGLTGTASGEGSTFIVTSNATESNLASTIVFRDGNRNFSANTITADLIGNVTGNVSGNAGTVTQGVYRTDTSTVTNTMLAGSIANNKLVNSSITVGSTAISLGSTSTTISGLSTVTSNSFVGNLTGDVTGNLTGNATGSSSNVRNLGTVTAESNGTAEPANQLTLRSVYNNGYPTAYGNVVTLGGQGGGELLVGWSGSTGTHADNYIRSRRDTGTTWSPWAKVLTDANFGSTLSTVASTGDYNSLINKPTIPSPTASPQAQLQNIVKTIIGTIDMYLSSSGGSGYTSGYIGASVGGGWSSSTSYNRTSATTYAGNTTGSVMLTVDLAGFLGLSDNSNELTWKGNYDLNVGASLTRITDNRIVYYGMGQQQWAVQVTPLTSNRTSSSYGRFNITLTIGSGDHWYHGTNIQAGWIGIGSRTNNVYSP